MSALVESVRDVARLRAIVARNRAALAELRDAFNAEHVDLLDAAREAEAELLAAETALRGAAEATYRATGDRNPAPGVQVKLRQLLNYKIADALAWARETKLALVPESVDEKALAKIAKATPLPFVTIVEEPTVALATDLDAALKLAAEIATPTETIPTAPPIPEPF